MALWLQLALGGVMIGATVVLHAAALDFIYKRAGAIEKILRARVRATFWRPLMAAAVVVSAFLSHIAQIWLWAFLYLALNAPPLVHFSDALYFSTVTYSTAGYGDIVLAPPFRMLSSIEAANGFLLFGWTAAFIFDVIAQLYREEVRKL